MEMSHNVPKCPKNTMIHETNSGKSCTIVLIPNAACYLVYCGLQPDMT